MFENWLDSQTKRKRSEQKAQLEKATPSRVGCQRSNFCFISVMRKGEIHPAGVFPELCSGTTSTVPVTRTENSCGAESRATPFDFIIESSASPAFGSRLRSPLVAIFATTTGPNSNPVSLSLSSASRARALTKKGISRAPSNRKSSICGVRSSAKTVCSSLGFGKPRLRMSW